MKLEGVTAFKIRPCVSRLNGIMDPALDAKTVGELVDNGGEIYIESIPSLAAEDCKLFTRSWTMESIRAGSGSGHLQHVTDLEICHHPQSSKYLSQKFPHQHSQRQ